MVPLKFGEVGRESIAVTTAWTPWSDQTNEECVGRLGQEELGVEGWRVERKVDTVGLLRW